MTIYEYEVEIKLTASVTKEVVTRTVTEYAYGPMDAVMQAVLNNGQAGAFEVALLRIGPPTRLRELAAQEASAMIAETMKRLSKLVPL